MSTSTPPGELLCNTVILNKQYYTNNDTKSSDNINKARAAGVRSNYHFYAGLIASFFCVLFLILAFTVEGSATMLIYSCLAFQTGVMAFTGYKYYMNKKQLNEATESFVQCKNNPELDKKK